MLGRGLDTGVVWGPRNIRALREHCGVLYLIGMTQAGDFLRNFPVKVMCSWMSLWLASEHVGRSFAHEREGTIDGGLSDAEVRERFGS